MNHTMNYTTNQTKPIPVTFKPTKIYPSKEPHNQVRHNAPPKWLADIYQENHFRMKIEKLLALFLLILTSPLYAFCFLLVKISSKGPAIYSQVRVGRQGSLFRVRKFRTMYCDAEAKTGAVLSWDNDPRITMVWI